MDQFTDYMNLAYFDDAINATEVSIVAVIVEILHGTITQLPVMQSLRNHLKHSDEPC